MVSSKTLWKTLGVGTNNRSLEKLQVRSEVSRLPNGTVKKWSDYFEVLFNPNELHFTRKVAWEAKEAAAKHFGGDAHELAFVRTLPERLKLNLFFDTYEPSNSGDAVRNFLAPSNPFSTRGWVNDVRGETGKLTSLAETNRELHQPPRVELRWGGTTLFQGVLARTDLKLTMFLADGTPVRATLACEFHDFTAAAEAMRRNEGHSSDVAKTVVLQATDSLTMIAAAEYGDPAMWRLIARANGIANPRSVAPGTVLILPPLPPS